MFIVSKFKLNIVLSKLGAASEAPSTTPIGQHPEHESTTSPAWWTESTTTATPSTTASPWWTQPTTQATQSTPWWTEPTTRPTQSTTTSPWWTQPPTTPTTTRAPTQPPAPPSTTFTPPSTTTTQRAPVTQATTTTTAPAVTPGSPDMPCFPGEHHPDPTNCNAYYRCILGRLKKEYCAGGLHWSAALHACDWPSKAGCQAGM